MNKSARMEVTRRCPHLYRAKRCLALSHASRHRSHLFWRVAQIEQLGLLHPLALLPFPVVSGAPAATTSTRPRDDHDLLDVRRVDKELHLDARALHHVPEDEGRVRPTPPHRDEHAGEGRRCVREVDGEHRAGTDAVGVRSREEGADQCLLFGGRERLLEIGHEVFALAEGCWG